MTKCPFPIRHHATCNADYPEKVPGEPPQMTIYQDVEPGLEVWTCCDCGASITRIQDEYSGNIDYPLVPGKVIEVLDMPRLYPYQEEAMKALMETPPDFEIGWPTGRSRLWRDPEMQDFRRREPSPLVINVDFADVEMRVLAAMADKSVSAITLDFMNTPKWSDPAADPLADIQKLMALYSPPDTVTMDWRILQMIARRSMTKRGFRRWRGRMKEERRLWS